MESKKNKATPSQTTDDYDDGNIPQIDLPGGGKESVKEFPDERPRKDGPGGE